MTELQEKIISIFKAKDTYNLWGFSAIGHRQIAALLKISSISAFNSMNNLFNKGIFYDKRAKNRYSDTIFYLKNENYVRN